MESTNNNLNFSNTSTGEFDLFKNLKNYTKRWKWFTFSCVIFVLIAFIYLRYATPEYNAYAEIMLLSDDNSNTPASAILKDLKINSAEAENQKNTDEIQVLKSRKIMAGVVKRLSLNIQLLELGRVHETQLYPNASAPIKINFIASDSIIDNAKFSFEINISSATKFNYKEEEEGKENMFVNMVFGKNITTPIGDIVITPNTKNVSNLIGKTIFVNVSPVDKVAEAYKDKILISQIVEFSKVINISLNDAVAERAQDVINTLIDEYNRVSIEEKNQRTKNTADFINERVNLIAADLSQTDDKIEKFKTGNKLTDISSESEIYLSSNAKTEEDLSQTKTQLNLLNYMKDYVDDTSTFQFIPSNVGMADGSINNLTTKYNDLLRERNSLLNGSTKEKNPIILNLNEQLNSLKNSLSQSLDNSSKSLKLQLGSLQNQYEKVNSKIFAVPGQVRKSRDIEREQGTKESLYLYLLQKREEATISLTSTSPNARVIDTAYSPKNLPVSPNTTIVYLAAIIFGLCVPFSIIYIKDLLDNKIHNKEDLEKIIRNITVLGEIPRLKAKELGLLVQRNDTSLLSESFRIIRTNFDFVQKNRHVKEYNNIIFVTSTINGEGKSFFSMNMALTLANTDKRVLLIGADIRNPKLFPAIKKQSNNNTSKIGLTEYLNDKTIRVRQAINTYDINNNKIDILLSGKVPPNPAELLMSDRMKLLFDEVSGQYDYVIVDTAPAMLVTDTLLFSQYAGHTFYITRADYTEKRILNFANELQAKNKLNGMMLVVNDVNKSNFGYGARYGYYGAPKKKSFFKRS